MKETDGWLKQEVEKAKREMECALNKIPPEQRKSLAIEMARREDAQSALLLLGVPPEYIGNAITQYMLSGEVDSTLHAEIMRIAKENLQS